jgi:monolysocardiolipin acyltransferase
MTSLGAKLSKHKLRLLTTTTVGLGATYLYYKPASQAPPIPYIPPPFVWESIPKPILKRFTLPSPDTENNILWKACSTMVCGGAGVIAKGFLNASQTTVYGLEGFLKIIEDPNREKGIITGT